MKKAIQLLVFLMVQIPLMPVAIIGVVLLMYKQYAVAKRLGISPITLGATPNKWLMHYFGTRPDEATVKFCKCLPMESHLGYFAASIAAIIANRVTGFTPALVAVPETGTETLATFQNPKTLEFDRIMKEYVDQVEQVVVMGAGFDLRVIEFTAGKNVKVFELDLENAQNLKLKTLKKAVIAHDWVTYISVNFDIDSWVDKLTSAGFDKSRKTLFFAESVTPYLQAPLEDTLEKVSELSAPGSVFAQDFFSSEFIESLQKMSSTLRAFNLWGVDMSGDTKALIESLLETSGFELTHMVLFGKMTKKGKPFCAITVAVKTEFHRYVCADVEDGRPGDES